jgi:hypothetical protein
MNPKTVNTPLRAGTIEKDMEVPQWCTSGGGDDSKEAQGPMGVKEGVEDKKHKRNPSDGRHRVAPK